MISLSQVLFGGYDTDANALLQKVLMLNMLHSKAIYLLSLYYVMFFFLKENSKKFQLVLFYLGPTSNIHNLKINPMTFFLSAPVQGEMGYLCCHGNMISIGPIMICRPRCERIFQILFVLFRQICNLCSILQVDCSAPPYRVERITLLCF